MQISKFEDLTSHNKALVHAMADAWYNGDIDATMRAIEDEPDDIIDVTPQRPALHPWEL